MGRIFLTLPRARQIMTAPAPTIGNKRTCSLMQYFLVVERSLARSRIRFTTFANTSRVCVCFFFIFKPENAKMSNIIRMVYGVAQRLRRAPVMCTSLGRPRLLYDKKKKKTGPEKSSSSRSVWCNRGTYLRWTRKPATTDRYSTRGESVANGRYTNTRALITITIRSERGWKS